MLSIHVTIPILYVQPSLFIIIPSAHLETSNSENSKIFKFSKWASIKPSKRPHMRISKVNKCANFCLKKIWRKFLILNLLKYTRFLDILILTASWVTIDESAFPNALPSATQWKHYMTWVCLNQLFEHIFMDCSMKIFIKSYLISYVHGQPPWSGLWPSGWIRYMTRAEIETFLI